MSIQSTGEQLAWWVGLSPDDFYREVRERAPLMESELDRPNGKGKRRAIFANTADAQIIKQHRQQTNPPRKVSA